MTAVLAILKNSTKHLHDELEQVSFAREIMSKKLSINQYHELLRKNHTIYKQIEPQLNSALLNIGKLFPQNFHSSRLSHLKKDLTYFPHQKNKNNTQHTFILNEKSTAAWLGVLYVLEGSRLGGNVIVKALKNNPHLKSIPEFHFYQQENINIRNRWMAFRNAAKQEIQSDQEVELAVTAANQTFDFFYKVHQRKLQHL